MHHKDDLRAPSVYLRFKTSFPFHTSVTQVKHSEQCITHETFARFLTHIRKPNVKKLRLSRFEANLVKLLCALDHRVTEKSPYFVAIDGFAGAGKTTLANALGSLYDANVYHTDDFFQKPKIDSNDPLSAYGANINFQAINETVINKIHQKAVIFYHPFDFKLHKHKEAIPLPYTTVHIFEGAFVLHPKLNISFDLKVFYAVNPFKQAYRIIKRSGFKRFMQFLRKWIPNEKRYVKALKVKDNCDLRIIS